MERKRPEPAMRVLRTGPCATAAACLALAMMPAVGLAQPERGMVRKGNGQYEDGKFAEAEITFRKAIDKNHRSYKGSYNLGNALYRQEKYKEAAQQFGSSLGFAENKQAAFRNLHNQGNALLKSGEYGPSVEAYKKAWSLSCHLCQAPCADPGYGT